MAFINAQVTQVATKKNQHIKQTINFASELVQLKKIASLKTNYFFARLIQNYKLICYQEDLISNKSTLFKLNLVQ